MKLTNYIREAFLTSALLEVPQVDYKEQIRTDGTKAIIAALPENIRAAYKNEATKNFVKTHYRNLPGGVNVQAPGYEHYNSPAFPVLAAEDKKHLDALAAKSKAQEETLANLRAKLRTAAFACNTRKALAEMLPEFEKYLPEEEDKGGRYLPAVANIVSDFRKAGWPGKAKAANTVAAAAGV